MSHGEPVAQGDKKGFSCISSQSMRSSAAVQISGSAERWSLQTYKTYKYKPPPFECAINTSNTSSRYPSVPFLHSQCLRPSSLMVYIKSSTLNTLVLLSTSFLVTRSERSLVSRRTQVKIRKYVPTVRIFAKGWMVTYWFGSGSLRTFVTTTSSSRA